MSSKHTNRVDRETVAEAIGVLLPRSKPTVIEAARLLRTSARTLQRRLAVEGCSYHEVVGQVRQAIARDLLSGGEAHIAEIAATLGYADPSSFSRAFTRWCGMAPRAYRRLGKQGCAEQPGGSPLERVAESHGTSLDQGVGTAPSSQTGADE